MLKPQKLCLNSYPKSLCKLSGVLVCKLKPDDPARKGLKNETAATVAVRCDDLVFACYLLA